MKKKIKIAIFHCGFVYSGGGERIVLEEAKGLKDRGFEVEVFAPTLDKKKCYPSDVKNLNVKTFLPQLPSFIPGSHAILMVLSSLFAPLLAFRFKDIDIFIGANQPGAWIAFCVAKVLKKPYFVYLNQPNRLLYPRKIDEKVNWQNLSEYYFIDNLIKKLRFFVSWADRISFTKGKFMFVNGNYIGKIIENIYKKPALVCPAGAYPQSFDKLKINPNTAYEGILEIKNKKGDILKIERPYILITNRHIPQKKFEYGIEAFEKVFKKNKKIKLVISGPFTPYTQELIELTKKLKINDQTIFTKEISEETLQELYRNAACYIYTAPDEDFGMGIIEAMGWGVPVVAWNFAGPTVTVLDGKTGFLARPYDVSDFAKKIMRVLEDPKKRSEMGKNAWEHVEDNFSWEKHVDILEKNIQSLLLNKI
ncbi:MAG: glycosyltransferase [Candidatus Levybacteria bacterium]|nr:glycosyltransferase [Candidatus Levybacteria bacterium]